MTAAPAPPAQAVDLVDAVACARGGDSTRHVCEVIRLEAEDLAGLVLQTQTSMRELERHWLVRKYVNKTNPPPVRPLSENAVPEMKPVKALRPPGDSAN